MSQYSVHIMNVLVIDKTVLVGRGGGWVCCGVDVGCGVVLGGVDVGISLVSAWRSSSGVQCAQN